MVVRQAPTERPVADLSMSRLIADRNTCLKGYCCLVLKPHVIETYELSGEESIAFMRDVSMAARALKKVTATVKINCEIHGNTIPHMHMQLYPRQIGDPFEDGPVDWRTRTPTLYQDGELEAFVERMKAAIEEVEQGAATDAAQRRRDVFVRRRE
jgi:diadenosine tetraphosphate (Ap4A) HIT family hydrolase